MTIGGMGEADSLFLSRADSVRFVAGLPHAQTSSPASAGVYTTSHTDRGKALYQDKCSSRRSDDLSGRAT
jgi:hypothetical protein